ncbi:hypothetical protein HHK36_015081 [Tetracentron sinense]|uniref:Pentatricopeptide repeat-containing protein n=1 Tax=Tetracentron sinense TaxID=13715 RepID=A0A834Z8K4_TETSI|nr:hypothetical protein HHK36_015081 [Tetracentron sinense]
MLIRMVVSRNTIIYGYSKWVSFEEALGVVSKMHCSGMQLNETTFSSVIWSFASRKIVHGLLIGYGFESDFSIGGALIDFYCCSDSIEDAKRVFDRLASPCLNVSNTLIRCLISMGRIEESERLFKGMVETNAMSYNLMIKGYAVSGRIEDSTRLFEEIPQRTIVSSNTMISKTANSVML